MTSIATNVAANTSLRYLNQNSESQSSYLAKISSGSRIQKASDDAGGLGVATRLNSDITVLEQNAINAQNGQSVLQTADGALSNIADILQRMKSLAAQSLSGSLDDDARAYINAEYQELINEIDAISNSTDFNNTQLLDGTYSQSFLVGTDATAAAATYNQITVTIADVTANGLGVDTTDVTDVTNATAAATALDAAIDTVSSERSNAGALLSRFQFHADVIASTSENLEASKSAIMDADIAEVQTEYTNAVTLTNAAIAALSKANQIPQELLRLLQS